MATKRKVRRFAEGEFIDTESESGEWAGNENYGDGTTREERVAMAKSPSYKPKEAADESAMESNVGQGKSAAPAAKQSFKDAFAAARKGGGKSFEWNGKKYTTEMAGEKKAAPTGGSGRGGQGGPTAAQNASRYKSDTAGAGRGGQGGPTADELESYAKSKKRPDIKGLMPSAEDTQKGLEIMAGGPGLKAVASAAKAAANRAPAAATKLKEYVQPQLGMSQKQLPAPTKRIEYDKAGAKAKERSERAAGREREKENFNRRSRELGEADSPFKKGGSVRGWGMARGARKAKIV